MEGIVGREGELRAVAALVEPAAAACPVLALDGDPGIGKTSVLECGVALARERGHRVLGCRPVESESALAFVSLGDLLEPVVSDGAVGAMPDVQRRALETALARRAPGEAFGRHAVSRATLAVLRALAERGPVLIAIDDAQWLDAATEAVVRFALRRLGDSRLRVLLASRSDHGVPVSLLGGEVEMRRIAIGPLSADELGRVVAGRLGVSLARPRLAELHATSGGNPYFALEIVRALLARGEALRSGEPLQAPESIAALLRARLAGRSPAALDVLLLAAASPQPTASRTAGVAGSAAGVREAVAEGMLEQDGDRLRFTHPLLASVVYAGADPSLRREAHARLAAATDDPDERAAHLARATAEPDESVAADLDAAADRAARRGAPATAAELEEHALRLTPADRDEARFARSLRTAEHHLAAGDTGRGRLLLERLLEDAPHGGRRARLALRLGQVRYTSDDVDAARRLFEQALADAGEDPGLCAEARQALGFTAMLGGDIGAALEHAHSSLALAERAGEPRTLSLALCRVGLNEFLGGRGLDRTIFERALALEPGHLDGVPVEWLPSYTYAWSCLMGDDLPAARTLYERLAGTAEERGDERFTASVLFAMSGLETRAGNWGTAVRLAAEAVERSRQSGLGTVHAWSLCAQALVAAHLGQVETAREAAAAGFEVAQSAGAIAPVTEIASALGLLELSLGDPAAAHAQLGPLSALIASVGIAEPGVVRFMANEIEALLALGDVAEARRLLELLDERARTLDRISARAAAARCAALLAAADGNLEAAGPHLDEAFAQHERLAEPFELARTLLVKGSLDRRAQRRALARTALVHALELFDDLGAALWSERAAAELARIPGRAPNAGELTASERRVAELVADGLANKEIAARLSVTVRTVEAHLSSVYAKLGLRSRVELARAQGLKTVDFHD